MCSVLFSKRTADKQPATNARHGAHTEPREWPHNLDGDSSRISVAKIGDVDMLDAVENVSAAALYALPEERLAAMRRSAAARKAVTTRVARANGATA
jgi:hypothetical protein